MTQDTLPTKKFSLLGSFLLSLLGLGFAAGLLGIIGLISIYPKLPDLDSLTDYRPKVPLRVVTAEGTLIGEFGEEKRRPVNISQVPLVMQKAVLAAEDDNFYNHFGVDIKGVIRALLSNIASGGKGQGASTITMQVARNFYLKRDKTWTRKIYEILLAFKIEANLSKDEILALYMNQIYLGQRAYGFASASNIYFGKRLQQITLAEAAMLAGLPKAPSAFNPIVNPSRAKIRQEYVLSRMLSLDFITQEEHDQAKKQTLKYKPAMGAGLYNVEAEYAAEMARLEAIRLFGSEAYTAGLTVFTTIRDNEQNAAYTALRQGVTNYELRQAFKGPEGFIEIPSNSNEAEQVISNNLSGYPDYGSLKAAVILSAAPNRIVVSRGNGVPIELTGASIKPAQTWLDANAPANKRLKRGAVVRVLLKDNERPIITQLPEVEAALIGLNANTGAIRALVGGFEFQRNKFNHVTQAIRQPGSSFKPFVYSAALEKGVMPTTLVADEQIFVPGKNGAPDWSPKNYDNTYDGPMLLKEGLAESKNMVSIRVLQQIDPKYAQQWVARFGFSNKQVPPYLTMALGAVTTNPLQMAAAYAVFANGGYRIKPYLVEKITDASGRIIAQARPVQAGNSANRVIDARNAFMMRKLLREVVERGTAGRAKTLGRNDIGGKTGTTNDSHDAWFVGISPDIVSASWVGFPQPRNLGARETGGGLALPIWLEYMREALKTTPERPEVIPSGIEFIDGNYFYSEFTPGRGIERIDVDDELPGGEIPNLFNFLKGLGVGITGEETSEIDPGSLDGSFDNSTEPREPDQIEMLFGN